jgi:hypothetical protein
MPPSCIDKGRAVAFAVGDWNAALDPVVPIGASLDNDIRVPADDFRLLIVGLGRTTSLAQPFQRDQRNIRLRLPVPTAISCFVGRLARIGGNAIANEDLALPTAATLESSNARCPTDNGPTIATRRRRHATHC